MTDSIFAEVVDDLVRMSDEDPDLAGGLRWIDEQAQRRGISFYEMVFEVLYRNDTSAMTSAGAKSRAWLERRN